MGTLYIAGTCSGPGCGACPVPERQPCLGGWVVEGGDREIGRIMAGSRVDGVDMGAMDGIFRKAKFLVQGDIWCVNAHKFTWDAKPEFWGHIGRNAYI